MSDNVSKEINIKVKKLLQSIRDEHGIIVDSIDAKWICSPEIESTKYFVGDVCIRSTLP